MDHAAAEPERETGTVRGTRIVALGFAVAALAGACGEGVFEVSPDAVYVLELVNGQPLPVLLGVSQFAVHGLEADTIRFIGERRFEVTRWTTVQENGSDAVEVNREVWTGQLRPAKGGVTLESDACLDPSALALCIPPDTARTEGGVLVLRGPVAPAGVKRYVAR
jgi:hypothetical protein